MDDHADGGVLIVGAPRTDSHRKGAIVPADYKHVISYARASMYGGMPIPSDAINCAMDLAVITRDAAGNTVAVTPGQHDGSGRCCVHELRRTQRFSEFGGLGKCSVCGAQFVYGDVWQHTPSGEMIHVGHDCAAKYDLLVDRSAYELALDRRRDATAVELTRVRNEAMRAEFLAAHPGLAEALALDHYILADMAKRFVQYRALSDKQVALAFKIADEIKNPKPAEAHVAAPVSDQRITVRGTVVGLKVQETQYGSTLRMTVKVATPEGSWLAWGTCPNAIAVQQTAEGLRLPISRGDEVEFSAMLRAGNEDYFSFFSRPTKARLIARAEAVAS